MKKVSFFFLMAAMLLLLRSGADAGAFSMGRLQTVSTDGSLDTIRNPALLAAHKEKNSMGFLVLYAPYQIHRYDYDAYINSWFSFLKMHEQKRASGSAYLSYTRKISTGSIGIAIDTGNPYQAEYYRYKKIYTAADGANSNYGLMKNTLAGLSSRFVFSYGGMISGNHGIGVQIAAEYFQSRETSGYMDLLNTSPGQKHSSLKKTEGVSSEISLGYAYHDAMSQVGVMVRSGRFSWQRAKINYKHAEFPTALFFAGSVSEPPYMRYDRGFGIVAGGYRKLGQFIAVALEGEFRIPINFAEKTLRYDEFTGFYGITVNQATNNKGLYGVRGGFEILPSGPVTISIGGGFSTAGQKKSANNFRETKTADEYSGSLGLDLTLTENNLIMIGSQFVYTHERRSSSSNLINPRSMDGQNKIYHLNSFLGMSLNF